MKYPVYSYRDVKTGFYSPRIEQSESSAIRSFAFNINSTDSMMNFAPADFSLYHIANFDDQTGVIEPISPIVFIRSGSDLIGGV